MNRHETKGGIQPEKPRKTQGKISATSGDQRLSEPPSPAVSLTWREVWAAMHDQAIRPSSYPDLDPIRKRTTAYLDDAMIDRIIQDLLDRRPRWSGDYNIQKAIRSGQYDRKGLQDLADMHLMRMSEEEVPLPPGQLNRGDAVITKWVTEERLKRRWWKATLGKREFMRRRRRGEFDYLGGR